MSTQRMIFRMDLVSGEWSVVSVLVKALVIGNTSVHCRLLKLATAPPGVPSLRVSVTTKSGHTDEAIPLL